MRYIDAPSASRCTPPRWYDCTSCQVTVFRCRRCRAAFYCGRDHQRGHWGKHRDICKEGIGSPAPPLAHLALPQQRAQPSPPLRSQAKVQCRTQIQWCSRARFIFIAFKDMVESKRTILERDVAAGERALTDPVSGVAPAAGCGVASFRIRSTHG